ncbi:hypothetical protein GCM10011348_38520 [Marinobacterium nitratireducens]|uniref:Uncharacterized protein n=1 Tax=Marinobacterium nitratireducens TaxID=518897 RepID=A0A917ZPC7_9GAMM|nr:hypothetical protein GCM10011348_38520 [Marinobacterium nitratireducens]
MGGVETAQCTCDRPPIVTQRPTAYPALVVAPGQPAAVRLFARTGSTRFGALRIMTCALAAGVTTLVTAAMIAATAPAMTATVTIATALAIAAAITITVAVLGQYRTTGIQPGNTVDYGRCCEQDRRKRSSPQTPTLLERFHHLAPDHISS